MKADEEIKKKIKYIFSHDGPGFRDDDINSKEFISVKDKIIKTVPESSIIGMLLQNLENYKIIKIDGELIMQHDPFLWYIKNGKFVKSDKLSSSAKYLDSTISEWISEIPDEQKK